MLGECAYYREKGVYWAQDLPEQPTATAVRMNNPRDEEPKYPHSREKKSDTQKTKKNKKRGKKTSKKSRTVEDSDEDVIAVTASQPTTLDKFITRPDGPSSKSSLPTFTLNDEDIHMSDGSEPMIMGQPVSHVTGPSSQASQSVLFQPTATQRSPSRSATPHAPVGNFSFNAWDPKQNSGPKSTRIRVPRIPKDNKDPSQTTILNRSSRSGSSFQSVLRETTPEADDLTESSLSSDEEYSTDGESASDHNYEGMYEDEIPEGK